MLFQNPPLLELFHILFKNNKELFKIFKDITKLNSKLINSSRILRKWGAEIVFEEALISSFLPEGYLGQKLYPQNTENKKHKYYFEVTPDIKINGKIEIKQPSAPFSAIPNLKKKKIVILTTKDILVDNPRQDTIIPITIRAYAVDDPEGKIVVYRKSTFTFPRSDKLKKK